MASNVYILSFQSGLPRSTSGKRTHLPMQRPKRHKFSPWVGKIPWSRKWQPTPVFFPGKSHGQRSLAGYSPWGYKYADTTEKSTRVHTHTQNEKHQVPSMDLINSMHQNSFGYSQQFSCSMHCENSQISLCKFSHLRETPIVRGVVSLNGSNILSL